MGMDALRGSAHGQKNSRRSDAEVSGLGYAVRSCGRRGTFWRRNNGAEKDLASSPG